MASYLGGVEPTNGSTIEKVRAVRLYYFLKFRSENVTLNDERTGESVDISIDYDAVAQKMEDAV